MITERGYSKDPTIIPEGIALTMPVAFFADRNMNTEQFKKYFERYMRRDDAIWNYRLTNLPKQEFYLVYLIFDGHIQYQCNFIMMERNVSKEFADSTDEQNRSFANANWILFTGPATKPAQPWPQKGFQGFRYTTKLF